LLGLTAEQRQHPPRRHRHQGHLTPEERSIAISAAKAMGLHVAGVDIIRSNHGALVIEVNSSPGLEGIEQATEKDVAGQIIEYVATHASAKNIKEAEKIVSEDH
jgi:ribosomal protein S6--L-glutamate ligase